MNTITHQPVQTFQPAKSNTSFVTRFFNWTKAQEENRLLWLALAIFGHGCLITIATMFAILFSGNDFIFWPFAIAAMAMSLIVNLAAMPTKITIPVFFFSVLIDIVIIVLCIARGFDVSTTYI